MEGNFKKLYAPDNHYENKLRAIDMFRGMINKERNIYALAELHHQNRHKANHFLDDLRCVSCHSKHLEIRNSAIICCSCDRSYPLENDVADLRVRSDECNEYEKLNKKFMNYHKSLSTYTLLNSVPIINYIAMQSGLWNVKKIKVLDVGGGTGHTYGSFFRYPDTIDYYLLDPNLRLLHDQFLRIYPELSQLRLSHILGYAEELPFRRERFDLVMSLFAIDHLKDFKAFIRHAYRVLKDGGELFICSDLYKPSPFLVRRIPRFIGKVFSASFPERFLRWIYLRRHRVSFDDHTFHFESSKQIEGAMLDGGFKISKREDLLQHCFLLGKKK